MNLKQLKRRLKKKTGKDEWDAIQRLWDIKMTQDVTDFIFLVGELINPKAHNAIGPEEWLYNGQAIEEEVWKLLARVRRITLLEKKKSQPPITRVR